MRKVSKMDKSRKNDNDADDMGKGMTKSQVARAAKKSNKAPSKKAMSKAMSPRKKSSAKKACYK